MKIVQEKSRYHSFAFYCDYQQDRIDFCRVLKESFGWQRFSFDGQDGVRRWVFSEPIFVKLLKEKFPETEVEPAVMGFCKEVFQEQQIAKQNFQNALDTRDKIDTGFCPRGVTQPLRPYQNVGIEFFYAAGGKAINADEPGSGKSAQGLGYAAHIDARRVLVICPASVKPAWSMEVQKWTKFSSIEIDSKTKIHTIPAEIRVWIINYDILKKHFNELSKTHFDLLIVDEAHMIKSVTTQRTKAVRVLAQNVKTIFLTGTPLLSRPVEMFPILNIIDPVKWGNYYDFTRRYCNGHRDRWGYNVSGATHMDELHEKIKGYFIRRTKKQILPQLPPKNRILYPVRMNNEFTDLYNQAETNLADFLITHLGRQAAEIAKTLQAEKLAQLNVLRQIVSMGKMEAAKDLIESIVQAGEKVIVFSSFVAPLEELKSIYKDTAVLLTGQTPVKERGDIVKRFQTDDSVRVFLGGIKSSGVGITLTAATNVVFIDYSWNPSDHAQGEDRLHRPGQTASSVNIYQLYCANTMDDRLQKILVHKQKIFDQIIDGRAVLEEESTNTIKEVTNDIISKYGRIIPTRKDYS